MSDETPTQPTNAELARRIQLQERQIAALISTSATQPPRQRRRNRLGFGSGVGLVLALLLGTVALAAIPGTGGVISGCYDKKNGKLRVIDAQAGKKCAKDEIALTWNQTGPQGAQGPIGPAGPVGPQGPKGDKGDSTGVPGPKGDKGDPGPQGIPGPKGDTGAQGAVGPAGAAGISGYEQVSVTSPFDSTASKQLVVGCPAGKRAIGGSASPFPSLEDSNRDTAPVVLAESSLHDDDAWFARAIEIGAYPFKWDLTVTVICANVAP